MRTPEESYKRIKEFESILERVVADERIYKEYPDKDVDTQNMITKVRAKIGHFYIYDATVFIDTDSKTTLECPIDGEFTMIVADHISGRGCAKCSNMRATLTRWRKTVNAFPEKVAAKFGNKYDLSLAVYKHSKIKLQVICVEHQIIFNVRPNDMLSSGTGCPVCGKKSQQRGNMAVAEYYKKIFPEQGREIHGELYDYSEVDYTCRTGLVKIICRKCEQPFWQQPRVHINDGCGCPFCGMQRTIEAIWRASKICGELFEQKSIAVHGMLYDYSKAKYEHSMEKVEIICRFHGTSFWCTPNHHLSDGTGCPRCRHKTEDLVITFLFAMENRLKTMVLDSVVKYQVSFDFSGKSKYDFQVGNILIELDGPQHFKQIANWESPQKRFEKDFQKTLLANKNGYKTIRILWEDVYNNNYNWKRTLIYWICKFPANIMNVFVYTGEQYDHFMWALRAFNVTRCRGGVLAN